MKIMKEANLKIKIEGEIDAWKFDGESHGLTHCMKAVDIIIDFPKHYLFLEFKDPQHPNALPKDRERYIRKFKAGKLDEDLKYKYRDSFPYQWAMGRLDKPIHYFVLVADDSLSGAELMNRSDSLSRILPLGGQVPELGISVLSRVAPF